MGLRGRKIAMLTMRGPALKTFLISLLLAVGIVFGIQTAQAVDGKVWVNTSTGVYHCPGTRYYGSTKKGVFQKQSEAESRGYRPAYGSKCFSNSDASSNQTTSSLTPSPANARKSSTNTSATQVWVNTKSSVYHCPGSRYYGVTKSGRFMTETEAENGGNRPAYGARCN